MSKKETIMTTMKLESKDSHICSHSLLDLYDLVNIIKVKGNSKCAPGSTEYHESKRSARSLSYHTANVSHRKKKSPFSTHDMYLENFCNCKADHRREDHVQ